MGLRHMQGTPAHLETLHPTDGVKRNRYRCIEYNSSTKKCRYTGLPCCNVPHCERYHETNSNKMENEFVISRGKKVQHQKYGEGIITKIKKIKFKKEIFITAYVQFDENEIVAFIVPNAFNLGVLSFKDS